MISIEDEHGQTWWVAKGDPIWDAVQRLRKGYYTWIVLPRIVIRGDTLPGYPTLWWRRWFRWWALPSRWAGVEQHKRAIRLVECLWELNK